MRREDFSFSSEDGTRDCVLSMAGSREGGGNRADGARHGRPFDPLCARRGVSQPGGVSRLCQRPSRARADRQGSRVARRFWRRGMERIGRRHADADAARAHARRRTAGDPARPQHGFFRRAAVRDRQQRAIAGLVLSGSAAVDKLSIDPSRTRTLPRSIAVSSRRAHSTIG